MQTETFNYTGAEQTWTVPSDVVAVLVKLSGAGSHAAGGYVEGALATTPGETLRFYVGGLGDSTTSGFNGGGSGPGGAWGGAGATDVRQGGSTLSDRKAVGAGGGGKGASTQGFQPGGGGQGGADTGQDGGDASTSNGGHGGDQTSGGSGGTGVGGGGVDGGDGSLGQGGAGGNGSVGDGGGGGGGLYGGGGGSGHDNDDTEGGGGAGGSNYDDDLANVVANERGTGSASQTHGVAEVVYVEPPSGLSMSVLNDGTIDLSWTDNATSEDGYKVYRDTSSGVSLTAGNEVADLAADSTSYKDEGLDPGTQYFYRVTAYTSDGQESRTSEVSATTDALQAPSDLSVDAINGDQFDLSFRDNSVGKDGYRVYRRPDGYITLNPDTADLVTPTSNVRPTSGFAVAVEYDQTAGDDGNRHALIGDANSGALTDGYRMEIDYAATDDLRFGLGDGSGNTFLAAGSGKPGSGVAIGTWDGSTAELYHDLMSTPAASGAFAGPIDYTGAQGTAIGSNTPSGENLFDGDLYRLAVYGRHLTESERTAFKNGETPNDALLVYEFADGSGSTVDDSSGNDNDGSTSGGPSWTGGGSWTQDDGDISPGWALDFEYDDLGDHVDIGDSPVFKLEEFTLVSWVEIEALNEPNQQYFSTLDNLGSGSEGWGMAYNGTSDVRIVAFDTDGNRVVASNQIAPTTGERFLAHVGYDGSLLYAGKNATWQGTANFSGTINYGTRPVLIGRERLDVDRRFHDGPMDGVLFYDRHLSESDLASIESGNPPSDGLVAQYKFDEGSGSTATNSGSGLFEGSHALDFDGTDYVTLPTDSTLNTASFSISFLVSVDVLQTQGLVGKRNAAGGNTGWRFFMGNDAVEFDANDGTDSEIGNIRTTALDPHTVYRVTGTYDDAAGEAKIYLDATETESATGVDYFNDGATHDAEVAQSSSNRLDGLVDDVLWYDRAIDSQDVSDIVAGSPPTSGLVGRWQFNEGSGTTATDSAGSNDGTINGATYVENTPDGTINGAEYAGALKVPYTTTNLLDGERYVLQARAFDTETGVESP